MWRGEIPFPRSVADCAPAGRRREWTTPLGALGSDGMGKTSRVLPVGNQVFSLLPTLASFRGLSVTGDGLTFWIISMVTHFHQKRDTYKLSENPRPFLPPSPTTQVSLLFQIAHLFLERHFRNLIGLRVGRNDEFSILQQPTFST